MIHGISPFSIYNPPAVRDIHPADIPAASPEPVTPVSHPMAQELLYDRWGGGWFTGVRTAKLQALWAVLSSTALFI